MTRRRALIIEARGERFRFYYDEPNVLHITRVHGTTPEDAIRTYLDGQTEGWDEDRMRFVTFTETYGLYWTRHSHDGSIIVISCFQLGDGE
ncbi:MAG TPA: hypothetical protein VJB57_05605 [Dehalococcoidia bacterium]|nr:hypothetical protein [Dehalococcoidia bacterium]